MYEIRPHWGLYDRGGWPPGNWGQFIANSFEGFFEDTYGTIETFEICKNSSGNVYYLVDFKNVVNALSVIDTLYLRFGTFEVFVDIKLMT